MPTPQRLKQIDNNRKQKLVFLLNTVFEAHDMAYQVMDQVNEHLAKDYLKFLEKHDSAENGFVSQAGVGSDNINRSLSKKPITDYLVSNLLPASTLNKAGSIRWFVEKEKQFGGLVNNVARNKVSRFDPRSPAALRRGGMQGGDRMSFNNHGYALAYSTFLKPIIAESMLKPLVVMEVGILKGNGLAIWCDLFPQATVLGLDIDLDHCRSNIQFLKEKGAFSNNQPVLHEFDQLVGTKMEVADFLKGSKIDVFIDDGLHTREAILNTFEAVKPFLAENFVAFIEDNEYIVHELRTVLPGFRILNEGEMTIICSDSDFFPRRLPSVQKIFFEMDMMQRRLGYKPNLEEPVTFNEKVVHRKLYGAPANAALMADKLAVRDYVKERVSGNILTKIYQVVDDPAKIHWEALPNQFVMKSNHSNAQVIIVKNKKELNIYKMESLCSEWISSTYGEGSNEYWYSHIRPLVFFEELLEDEAGSAPSDYKVHVFGGKCRMIQKISGRYKNTREFFYDAQWNPLSYRLTYPRDAVDLPPICLEELVYSAEKIAENFDYLRVDFYIIKGRVVFGECTFAPAAGWDAWKVDGGGKSSYEVDVEIGAWWKLSDARDKV